jgi:hypothetical protein
MMNVTNGSALSSSNQAPAAPVALNGWKLLAPLPDPIGFGGMFAGVLNGRLVAGGGSQFHDKPLWLKGTKIYSDRIFVLPDPTGAWTTHEIRLPFKAGHYAAAYTAEAIYVAGGMDQTGCISQAWEIRAQGDGFAFNRLPDLPKTVAYAAAVVTGGRLYVLGGQDVLTVRVASAEVWSLGLDGKSAWRREPDLPGVGVFLAAAAAQADAVYLFGGVQFDAAGKAVQSAQVLRLDLVANKWTHLADLPVARVATSTPCPLLEGGRAFLIGGYDQSFPGAPRDHPGFPSRTLVYDLARQSSVDGPPLPTREVADRDLPGDIGPAPMVAAPAVVWRNLAVVISGEVRASVRTPAVVAWPLEVSPEASR